MTTLTDTDKSIAPTLKELLIALSKLAPGTCHHYTRHLPVNGEVEVEDRFTFANDYTIAIIGNRITSEEWLSYAVLQWVLQGAISDRPLRFVLQLIDDGYMADVINLEPKISKYDTETAIHKEPAIALLQAFLMTLEAAA